MLLIINKNVLFHENTISEEDGGAGDGAEEFREMLSSDEIKREERKEERKDDGKLFCQSFKTKLISIFLHI